MARDNSGPKPPPRSLSGAIHDALTASPVSGFSARITFTNHLFPTGSLPGSGSPLLTGATGRVWVAHDGRFRLELQSQSGDAQVIGDGKRLRVYDATAGTAYRFRCRRTPARRPRRERPSRAHARRHPGGLARLSKQADLSGAIPGTSPGGRSTRCASRPSRMAACSARLQLAWDAEHGVPLEAAVYSRGDASPVLELTATDVHYGADRRQRPDVHAAASVKATTSSCRPRRPGHTARRHASRISGVAAVGAALPFKLAAPRRSPACRARAVRLVGDRRPAPRSSLYGEGLGASRWSSASRSRRRGRSAGRAAARCSINGAPGHELATALGTVLHVRPRRRQLRRGRLGAAEGGRGGGAGRSDERARRRSRRAA